MAKLKVPEPRVALKSFQAYVPGEQPHGRQRVIKINTNENAYPVPPAVMKAIKGTSTEQLRRYSSPTCQDLRQELSRRFSVSIDQVIMGNGSDEILRMICFAYLEKGDRVALLEPTYSLFEVLVKSFEGEVVTYPVEGEVLPRSFIKSKCKIAFLPNPNPPLGTFYSESEVRSLIEENPRRLVVLDEAYVDFSPRHFMQLVREYSNLIVTRTFSKSYSMAGVRLGYGVGQSHLILPLYQIKDSYNVNVLTQVVGLAALKAQRYFDKCNRQIARDREWLKKELEKRGFNVAPSGGNFLFARHKQARILYEGLKERRILVRYFTREGLNDGLRITIGTKKDMQEMLRGMDEILKY